MDVFEPMIQGLIDREYGMADSFITPELTLLLRERLLELYHAGQMHEAGIGRQKAFQKNKTVRGDVIAWLDYSHENTAETAFLNHIQDFIDTLNRECYTGINAFEAHFAYYDTGSFYRRHIDQFRSDGSRKFSMVTYLNEAWCTDDGGSLGLYFPKSEVQLLPIGGRSVFFRSDAIEHEVKQAKRPRLSIAAWLKRI